MIILAHKKEFILPKGVEPTSKQKAFVNARQRRLKKQGPVKVRIPKNIKNYFRGGPVVKRMPVEVNPGQYILPWEMKPTKNQLEKIKRFYSL
jgi:hypothetical protein